MTKLTSGGGGRLFGTLEYKTKLNNQKMRRKRKLRKSCSLKKSPRYEFRVKSPSGDVWEEVAILRREEKSIFIVLTVAHFSLFPD